MATNRTRNPLPLIDSISIPGVEGVIGITSCPGIRDEFTFDLYGERLVDDVQAVRDWGAHIVVTLLEPSEIHTLGVSELGKTVLALDMVWLHLPVRNRSFPDEAAGDQWHSAVICLCNLLRQGERVVVHCKEGIGRAGLLAARLVMGLGVTAAEAIRIVRKARPGSLSLYSHEQYIYALDPNVGRKPAGDMHALQSGHQG